MDEREHRLTVQARLEIVDALIRALNEPGILELVDSSSDYREAARRLQTPPTGFTESQAQHVLDMTMSRRTRAGRDELRNEAEELRRQLR